MPLVELKEGPNGGLAVPEEALQLVWELHGRGMTLRQEGEMLRVVGPGGSSPELTTDDESRLKHWKFHVLALLAYKAPNIE